MPNNIDMERSVLGALMYDPMEIGTVSTFLHATHFYREAHRLVYTAMLDLFNRRCPTDLLSVCDELTRTRTLSLVGGDDAVADICTYNPASLQAEYHARLLVTMAVHRKLIEASGTIAALGYEQVPGAYEIAEAEIFDIGREMAGLQGREIVTHVEALTDYEEELDAQVIQAQKGAHTGGIPTGFSTLDAMLGGLRATNLYILAARPSVGKTALALNIAGNAVRQGHNVLFFSLEMARKSLLQRWVAMHAGVDSMQLRDGRLNDEEHREVKSAIAYLKNLPGKLYIDDSTGLSHMAIRSKARRLHSTKGLHLIVVDYLQLAKAGENERQKYERHLEVAEVSRNLKALARELEVPVLSLAQLNRAIEQRGSKTPMLSDLKESGAIEQDADVVMFIHRDESVRDEQEYPVTLMVEKHRDGPRGEVALRYIARQTRYYGIQ